MRHTVVLLAVGLVASPALARPAAGIWVSEEGDRVELQADEAGEVHGRIVVDGADAPFDGVVEGDVVRGTARYGGGRTLRFSLRSEGPDVLLTLPHRGRETRLQPDAPEAPAAGPVGEHRLLASDLAPGESLQGVGVGPPPFPPLAPEGPEAKGAEHRVPHLGWSTRLPQGWSTFPRDRAVALGHPDHPGLVLLEWLPARDAVTLRARLADIVAALGAGLPPPPALWLSRTLAGPALYAETSAASGEGARARGVAVVGPLGAVTIVAFGDHGAAAFAHLRDVVDAIARSVRLFRPEPSEAQAVVQGGWWSFTTGRSDRDRGREQTRFFCPDGRYVAGVARARGAHSLWVVEGDAAEGTITLLLEDGTAEAIPFRADPSGQGLYLDGALHGRVDSRSACR